MAMMNMPPKNNSNNKRAADARPEVKKVNGAHIVEQKPKTFGQRLKEQFIPADPKKTVEDMVIDKAVPALKSAALNLINSVASSVIYGDVNHTIVNQNSFGTNYNKISQGTRPVGTLSTRVGHVDVYEYATVGFDSQQTAEEVLTVLQNKIRNYGYTDVATIYECIDQPFNPIDTRYGWTNLYGVRSYQGRDGYWYLDLPRAQQL